MQAAKLAGPATVSASGALLFVALFFGDGTSGGRLFWLGAPALLARGVLTAARAAPVPRWAGLGCLVALVAATAVPLGLWLAASRGHHRAVRAAGALLVYLAELVVVLTYSRGGVAVAALAALAWLAVGRDRLESLGALVVATPAAALVAVWAFSPPAITDDLQPYADPGNDRAWVGVFIAVGAAGVGAR